MSETEQEKQNKKYAMMSTAGVVVGVLILMFLAMAWRAPDPPLPEYGIELNFGTDTRGSGAVQPKEPVGSEQSTQEEVQETKVEESTPEPTESTEPDNSKPAETSPTQQQVASPIESPVSVKEKNEEKNKPVEKPVQKPAEQKAEPKKEEPKKDAQAMYNPNAQKSNNTSSDRSGKAGSQGDDANASGDKGDPKGSVDAKALYGKAGGGDGGSSLSLDGWDWDEIPRPKTPNNESGRIVFRIKVDGNGELTRIDVIERSVGPEAERACREAVQKLTFSKKPGAVVPQESTGTITFVIRSK